ncbi:MAG: LuxR C-terminal-related transcriptional regulator [Dehalococcoidia bacterium]
MAAEVVSVFIVDDQPVFRLGLRSALEEEGISVLGESSLSDEAIELVCSFHPRVALVGTAPPRHRGLDLCRRIGQRCPGLPVILMTPSEQSGELFEAIRSGAWGYVSKLAEVETILQAIRKVSQGEMPLQDAMAAHPDVGRQLLEEFQSISRNPRLRDVMAPLSEREMQLLQQLGQGRSNKEIAHTLHITTQTVKNHITSILRKLDVNDRTQAVLAGLRYGWITLEETAPDEDGASILASSNR